MSLAVITDATRPVSDADLALLTVLPVLVQWDPADGTVTLDFGSATPVDAEVTALADSIGGTSPAESAARETARVAVKAIITDLQAEKTRCDTVLAKTNNQIGGADTKEVARAAKRIADAAIDLARLVKDI